MCFKMSRPISLHVCIMINVSCCASINAPHVQLFDDKSPGTGCTKGGSDIQQIFSTTGKKAMTPGILNSYAMKVTSTRKC